MSFQRPVCTVQWTPSNLAQPFNTVLNKGMAYFRGWPVLNLNTRMVGWFPADDIEFTCSQLISIHHFPVKLLANNCGLRPLECSIFSLNTALKNVKSKVTILTILYSSSGDRVLECGRTCLLRQQPSRAG